MSSKRESFAHRSRSLMPYSALLDFPIPLCEDCKAPMVKLENKWGCKNCTKLTVLRPVKGEVVDGQPTVSVRPVKVPLGEMYPNRAARRRMR